MNRMDRLRRGVFGSVYGSKSISIGVPLDELRGAPTDVIFGDSIGEGSW